MAENLLRLVAAKRDGRELDPAEVAALIEGYGRGELADVQMAAFAMAVNCRGMTAAETAALTDAMLRSGVVLDWPDGPPVLDKHSTGGVGDKVSLPLAAMLAACGARVPMISGRGLGPTGGTLDKLESIAGYRTDLSLGEIKAVVADVGCAITGASGEIAPADRRLYALRDVTATVPSIPLITASIMSKKLAAGLQALVLDVKCGSGAFMKTREDARALAESLAATGRRLGVETRCLITDMSQPLGRMVGNAVEVDESLEALRGEGPDDLAAVTLALGAEVLAAVGLAEGAADGEAKLRASVASGEAMRRFEAMVAAQGGDLSADRPRGEAVGLAAPRAGVVAAVENEQVGWAVIEMGGGRWRPGEAIDHSVGLEMLVRVGDAVDAGQPWARVFAPKDAARREAAVRLLESSLTIAEGPVDPPPLIAKSVGADS